MGDVFYCFTLLYFNSLKYFNLLLSHYARLDCIIDVWKKKRSQIPFASSGRSFI